jgi:hypothetical protein
MMQRCAICGREFPVYRLASVVLDGRVAVVCPRDSGLNADRIEVLYSPRTDQAAIQPSTSRGLVSRCPVGTSRR